MSKVLKVFVNLILILFILVAAALFVPPLAGISTVVSEPEMATNIQTGSVVYGKSTQVSQLAAGDEIVVTDDGSAFVYEIQEIDPETGVAAVTSGDGTEPAEVTLRTAGQKVLLTVPYIGYVSIATQTMEGRIVLGLAVALLIILFIIAEVWSRKIQDDEEEDEEEDEFYADLAEKKKRSDAEEERRFQTSRIKEQLAEPVADQQEPEEAEVFIRNLEPAREEPEPEMAPEAAAETTEEDDEISSMQAALENTLVREPMNSQGQTITMEAVRPQQEAAPLKADEIVLAIPAKTVEELLQEAYKNGEDPKVEKDDLTGVTFVDFSDCL